MAIVVRQNKLQRLDTFLFYKCHAINKASIKALSVWVSKSGDGPLYLLLGLCLYCFDGQTGKAFWWIGLAAFAIELPIYLSLKNMVKRHRPFDKLQCFSSYISPSDRFSMPSGHTAAAFVFATLLSRFYPETALFAYSWASVIGLSRVLLGVHFPGDILAGAVLGYASAWLALDYVYPNWW